MVEMEAFYVTLLMLPFLKKGFTLTIYDYLLWLFMKTEKPFTSMFTLNDVIDQWNKLGWSRVDTFKVLCIG